MATRTRRTHSPLFNSKVALAAMAGDETLAGLAQQFEVHPNQRKKQLNKGAVDVFGKDTVTEPSVDLKVLHTKIGQLTLENDFLEGALTKVGLLSAGKRGTRLRRDDRPWSCFIHQSPTKLPANCVQINNLLELCS